MAPDNPFERLGLARRFALAPADIQRAYMARMRLLHPDGAGVDADADDEAALLNEAKRTLEDPEKRAVCLLTLLGGPDASEDRALPDGFLMEMMDIRAQAEAAIEAGDSAEIRRFELWADERRSGHIASVGELFSKAANSDDAGVLRSIRLELNAWRYIERMLEQLDPDVDPLDL